MTLVRFFAGAAEAAGTDEEVRDEATLGALREGVVRDHPALARILPRCSVLVDGIRKDDADLAGADTVDVLPPFAGG